MTEAERAYVMVLEGLLVSFVARFSQAPGQWATMVDSFRTDLGGDLGLLMGPPGERPSDGALREALQRMLSHLTPPNNPAA